MKELNQPLLRLKSKLQYGGIEMTGKKLTDLPKAEGRLAINSNPTWNAKNLNKAASIWMKLKLHETEYFKCNITEEEAVDAAFNFDEANGYPKTSSKIVSLSNALRDHLKNVFKVHVERFFVPGGTVKMCMPDENMMDGKAIHMLRKASGQYKGVLRLDERHPDLMTINPTTELANNVTQVIDTLNVGVDDRKAIAETFAASFAKQKKLLEGKTDKEVSKEVGKEIAAGVISAFNNNPDIKKIDTKRPDEYVKSCKEAAK